tara:strand:+ start:57 stop:701 length:645 start_codon:yes stop_codon:yes gene_type:complete
MIFKKKETLKDNKDKISVEENFLNLKFFSNIMSNIEHFVFFGTLLGLVRDGNLIENDDDIDFYVNIKEREKLIQILKDNSIYVDLNLKVNKNESFLQVKRDVNNKNAIVDFYFYEDDLDKYYIIEKWNFQGGTHKESEHLRIPKIFTHPIIQKKIKSIDINFPAKPIYLCDFLYGKNWKVKMKKNSEYTIKVIDGKPVLFKAKKTFFGKKYFIE